MDRPQACAAIAAPGGAVGLLEGIEDDVLLVLREYRFRCRHDAQHQRAAWSLRGVIGLQSNAAPIGELGGIGEKILQDLAQLVPVAVNPLWNPFAQLEP